METRRVKKLQSHPIQTVARRTGLTADVIRVWERRYRAVVPQRSETGRRLYSDEDVERLLLLRRATLSGRRIGDVAQMPTAQLAPLVEADDLAAANAPRPALTAPGALPAGYRQSLLDAVVDLDSERLDATLRQAARDLSVDVLIGDVIAPAVEAIGDGWADGRLTISSEHLATSMIRSILESLLATQSRVFAGPEIIVTTPTGQTHELGALMASVVAAADGWRVTYLGPELPGTEIAAAALTKRATAVALSLIYPDGDEVTEAELVELRRALPTGIAILVGGRAAASYDGTLDMIGARRIGSIRDLSVALSALAGRAKPS